MTTPTSTIAEKNDHQQEDARTERGAISALSAEVVEARFPMFDLGKAFSAHTDHGSGGTYNRSPLG